MIPSITENILTLYRIGEKFDSMMRGVEPKATSSSSSSPRESIQLVGNIHLFVKEEDSQKKVLDIESNFKLHKILPRYNPLKMAQGYLNDHQDYLKYLFDASKETLIDFRLFFNRVCSGEKLVRLLSKKTTPRFLSTSSTLPNGDIDTKYLMHLYNVSIQYQSQYTGAEQLQTITLKYNRKKNTIFLKTTATFSQNEKTIRKIAKIIQKVDTESNYPSLVKAVAEKKEVPESIAFNNIAVGEKIARIFLNNQRIAQ